MRSHRGVGGGYSLGRAAGEISLRDLAELLEGVDTNRCGLSLEDQCPVMGRCPWPLLLLPVWFPAGMVLPPMGCGDA